MKKVFVIIAAVIFSFGLIGCESMGELAGGIAQAAGASDDQVKAARAVGTGIATFAEAKKAADALTPENEYYLGRAVAANIAGTYTIYRNSALQTYLNKICSTLVINSPRPDIYNGYHVAILNTDEINAFATPGGHIFVTRGLIACAANEDALAAVIAHEIAHIQLQHALTSIRNARYVNAAVSGALAGYGEAAGGSIAEITSIMGESVNEIITTLVVKGFSKKQELDADETALSLLAKAGYQPSGLIEMLTSLNQKQGSDKTKGFGKTHPTPNDRITAAKKVLTKFKVEDTRSYRTKRFGTATG